MMLIDVVLVMFAAWLFTLVAFLMGVRVGRQQTLVMHGPEKTRVVQTSSKPKKKEPFPEPVSYKKPWEREADAKSSS